ncbi:putative regulatory prophage protein [Pseudomonas phage Quinobequin-P09]|uniref:Putative regulatory prophage protein n=1 Tax=Pseudomonas phage Quinobequin-P09 TaxID=2660687 RepID=A0A5P8PQW2_9CAUD|nr:putative regulatory prophage protein [Pseudomonas phage Quinobequin-P09]QFR59656.1 putative regulatory prophage protein [Pseudomonas phage Quinobequin-P09]
MLGFDSYAEASRSGKGLHIWVRGSIGKGVRRDGVEIYSQERFIICTGSVVQDKPVRECQPMLLNMASQMRPKEQAADFALEELAADEDDWSVLVRAVGAANSDKFCGLWLGQWESMGFPSQSEADLALMSMLTFYSPSNDQCRRLFRDSALGKREKSVKDDRYLNRTLATIRSREAREKSVNASALVQAADTMLEARRLAMQEVQRLQGGMPAAGAPQQRTAVPLHVQGRGDPVQLSQPTPVAATMAGPVSMDVVQAGSKGLPWPPGFAGRIAQYIYQSAPRPVKEVAIVASLGLLAGLCGKAWHIPQSGLNMYIILVARSAIGKEAMHSGISSLIRACTSNMPTFHNFIDFTDFASGPALIKACASNPSFVNVSGEWGRKLKRLANDDRDGPLSTLRTQMTNLYQKSGPQSIVGGIGYSNKDNNIASISGVAYSMIGETTPSTFYEALTESMMEDGFLSRFLIIEYDGERPPMNSSQVMVPDAALQDALVKLAFQAQNLIGGQTSQPLGPYRGSCSHHVAVRTGVRP